MKPNLNRIIEDNLDKAKFQSKLKPSLPKNTGWLDGYADGGLLSKKVTCSNCGWSWKAVDGGMDPMTCHKCGGMIKMKHGGETYISGKALATQFGQYDEGGPTDKYVPITMPDLRHPGGSDIRGFKAPIEPTLSKKQVQDIVANNKALAAQQTIRSAKKLTKAEQEKSDAKLKELAQQQGNDFVNGRYEEGLLNKMADSKLANNAWNNLVEPGMDAAMIIEGAGLAGKGLKAIGKYAVEKIPSTLKNAGKYLAEETPLKNFSKNFKTNILESNAKDPKYHNISFRSDEAIEKGIQQSRNTIETEGQKILKDLHSNEGKSRLKNQFKLANPSLNEDQLQYLVDTRLREVEQSFIYNQPKFYQEVVSNNPVYNKQDALTWRNYVYPKKNAHWSSENKFIKSQNAPESLFPNNKSISINENNPSVINLEKKSGYDIFTDPNYSPGSVTLGEGLENNIAVLDHEGGHAIQKGGVMPIDTQLQELVRSKNPFDKIFQKFLNKESIKDRKYFRTAGNRTYKNEGYPFLVEQRKRMIEDGILKNRYDEITPLKLLKARINAAKNVNENFIEGNRLIKFTPPWKYKKLAEIMNTAPAVIPAIGVGTAAALNEEKYGGDISIPNLNNNWLSKYENGSVVDYLADKNQDFSYSHRKELAKELGIENYRGTAEQNLQMLSMLKQASQPKQEIEEVEQTDVQPYNPLNPFLGLDNTYNKESFEPINYSLSPNKKTPSISELKSKITNRTKPQEAPVKKAVVVNNVKIPEYNAFDFIKQTQTASPTPVVKNVNVSKIPEYDAFGFIKALPPRPATSVTKKVNEKHWYDGLKDVGKYFYDIDNQSEGLTNKDYKDAFRKLTVNVAGLISNDKKIQAENYFKRSDLKNNDNLQETKTKLIIPKNTKSPDIITGDTIPLPFKNKLTDIPNRYIIPGQINLTNTKWGYRNRGEYKDITTEGGDITLFNNLVPAKEFFKKNPNAKETDSFIGLTPDGTLLAGNKKDFINSNNIISQTFSNKIIDFPRDSDGKLLLKQASTKASSKHLSPVINVIGDNGKTSLGSLNFLIPKNNKDANSFGDITGGRVIFKAPDGKMKLAIGSAENIAQIFEQFKKEGNYPYLTAFTNDNGTYGPGLRTKSGKITAGDLKKYQGANETGSVFMYLKPGNYNKNTETKTQFKDVQMSTPNIRNENDESFKKGHPLINQQKAIVLHHTGYSDTTGISKGMSEAMRGVNNQFSKVGESSHVVIDFDGTRYNYAKPSQVAFHAGKSLLNGKDNVNDFGIGIEFQGDTDKKRLTDKQIDSFIEYIAPIIKEKQIPLENIITHKQIRSNYMKANPTDKQVFSKPDVNELDYQRILAALKKKKLYK